jgi:hypothetical protein
MPRIEILSANGRVRGVGPHWGVAAALSWIVGGRCAAKGAHEAVITVIVFIA